jgi:hypothetical protein
MGEMDFDGIQELVVGYQNDLAPSRTIGVFKRDGAGVLQPPDVYAAVAYVLNLNGIIPEDRVMDATSLPKVMMPGSSGSLSIRRPMRSRDHLCLIAPIR